MAGSTLRERMVSGNFGQIRPCSGASWYQIAELHLNTSMTVTVSTAYKPFPRSGSAAALPPKINVRIISGSGMARSEVRTLAGNPKTVSGTDFYVEAQTFFDENGDDPAPQSDETTTDVVAYFSEGLGQDLQPTTWYGSEFRGQQGATILVGAFQNAFVGPVSIREIQGYNHSPNPTWLMIFDWPPPGTPLGQPPPNGTIPKHIIPIPGAPASPGIDPYYSDDYIESKSDFTYGVLWATSATGDQFTLDNGGLCRVEIERYRGEQFQGTVR